MNAASDKIKENELNTIRLIRFCFGSERAANNDDRNRVFSYAFAVNLES